MVRQYAGFGFRAISGMWMVLVSLLLSLTVQAQSGGLIGELTLSRREYVNHLRGLWLGESIANWTGLNTEGQRPEPPFYTDEDWGSDKGRFGELEFILQDVWGSDDDTDIEYVYLHLLTQHKTALLTADQISAGWQAHINDFIWVSNAQVRELLNQQVLPPVTGMGLVNSDSLMIDAQLTTEIFGALAPGAPLTALAIGDLPNRTSSDSYATHAAEFHVVLYALAPRINPAASPRDQILWMVSTARTYLPDSSKSADVIDFVLAHYLANPDVNDWESTRDAIYERYHGDAKTNGFVYRTWWESSVNLATGLMALLYGEGDYRRTVQIGTLSGWDSDNGTATMGGLLGLMYGYDAIVAQFPDESLSDRYNIYRTRDELPDYLHDDDAAEDTFALIAARMLPVIDRVFAPDGSGETAPDAWVIAPLDPEPLAAVPTQRLTASSANNQLLLAGGTITASHTGLRDNGKIDAIFDGIEHDFSGLERYDQPDYWVVHGDTNDQLTITLEYDRPVMVSIVRLIEGDETSLDDGIQFETVTIEVKLEGNWQSVNLLPTTFPTAQFLSYQQVDFALVTPVEATGIRLKMRLNKGNAAAIAEVDVLAAP